MIKIIKVGMTSKGYRRFECTACGTLWDADGEHFEQAAGLDLYYSTCPVCGLACGEQRQKEKPNERLEYSQESRWTLLKKQYPNIKDNAKYSICARDLGYDDKDCDNTDCKDCWDMPIEEGQE